MSSSLEQIKTVILGKLQLMQIIPGKRSYRTYFITIYMIISHIIQVYYAGLLIIRNTNDFLEMATGVKSIGVNCQIFKLFAVLRDDDLVYLLKNTDKFWQSDQTEAIHKKAYEFVALFLKLVYVCYAFIILLPLFLGSLPFPVDYPDLPYMFWLFGLLQCIQFWYAMTLVLATDCFFLCLAFFSYGQLKMLNNRLENIGENGNIKYHDVISCVNHHIFIFEYTHRFGIMFKTVMLAQFCTTTISVCVEIFVFTQQSVVGMAVSVLYLCALLFQLALYCFPAELVIQESLYSAQAIINSHWYEHPKFSKIFVQHIIRRSQKVIVFSAGGLTNINRFAFTVIFKWALSLYTLLKDMARLQTNLNI